MGKTTRARGLLLLPTLLLLGCGSGDESPGTGDEQNLTERDRVAVDVQGYVLGGFHPNLSDAKASLAKACDAWAAQAGAIAGDDRVLDPRCGEPESLASHLLGAEATAEVMAEVPKGSAVVSSDARAVFGDPMPNLVDQVARWTSACSVEVGRAREIYGARLVAATCTEPTRIDSGYFTSGLAVHVSPASAEVAELEGWVVGESSPNLSPAMQSWSKACDAWINSAAALSGDALAGHQCGAPVQLDYTSSRKFGSATRLSVAVGERGATASRGVPVTGQHANLAEALAAWQAGCEEEIAQSRELFGDRLLAATCAQPVKVKDWQFEGGQNQLVASAGSTQIVVEGYVLGYSANLSDALAKWRGGYDAWLDGMVASVGVERIEGHEGDATALLPGSTHLLGAKTRIYVGVDLGDDETVEPVTTKVASKPVSSLDAAIASLESECSSAVAKAKEASGDAFVAASCGEAVRLDTLKFESTLTVWSRAKR